MAAAVSGEVGVAVVGRVVLEVRLGCLHGGRAGFANVAVLGVPALAVLPRHVQQLVRVAHLLDGYLLLPLYFGQEEGVVDLYAYFLQVEYLVLVGLEQFVDGFCLPSALGAGVQHFPNDFREGAGVPGLEDVQYLAHFDFAELVLVGIAVNLRAVPESACL